MSLPGYVAYKDSGVEWLGSIPRHWEITRLKRRVRLLTEKSDSRSRPVALENIEGWSGRFIETEGEFEGDGVAFAANDILFGKLRPYLAKVFLADSEGEAVGDFHVMRPDSHFVPRYAQYQMLQRQFIDVLDGETFGSKMPRASWESLGGMPLLMPELEEQRVIADFLDHEIAKIDALIAEQGKLIALLAEKRQATISHAVTRGLNPDVPLKDSGIPWLGEVPATWEVRPLGSVCERVSYGFTNPMPTTDEGPFLLTANDIGMGFVAYESARRTSWGAYRELLTDKSRPENGDVLITKDGTLGRVAIFDGSEACINQSVAVLRLMSRVATPEFVALALSGATYQERMVFDAGGTTIKHIYISRLVKMPFAVPPIKDQRTIVDALRVQLDRQAALAREAQAAAALLKERRSALITAAVTGQIDVRGVVPLPEMEVTA